MAEQNGTDAASQLDWRQEVNRSLGAADLLRETLQTVEKLQADGVEVAECLIAIRLVKHGVETPFITASAGSPMVLEALASWLESATRGLVQKQWWLRLGLPQGE